MPKTLKAFRLPASLCERLKRRAEATDRTETAVLEEALDIHLPSQESPTMSLITVDVLCNGRVLPTHHHRGEVFVEAPTSGEYTLRLTSHHHGRLEVVVSVDGLSVMGGREATIRDRGYVLSPCGSMPLPGWRLDNKEGSHFEFRPPGESYSVLAGHGATNLGVIGVAVFRERAPMPIAPSASGFHRSIMRGGGHTFGASAKGDGPESVGTGFGRRVSMPTSETSFERSTFAPAETVTLRYATRAQLVAWGVIAPLPATPNAFPGDVGCTPPPGWRG